MNEKIENVNSGRKLQQINKELKRMKKDEKINRMKKNFGQGLGKLIQSMQKIKESRKQHEKKKLIF